MIFDIVQKKLGNCAEKKDKSDFIFMIIFIISFENRVCNCLAEKKCKKVMAP
jgi:hypothetical protein